MNVSLFHLKASLRYLEVWLHLVVVRLHCDLDWHEKIQASVEDASVLLEVSRSRSLSGEIFWQGELWGGLADMCCPTMSVWSLYKNHLQDLRAHLHHMTINTNFQPSLPLTYLVLGFGRGGRPRSLALLAFCLSLLGVWPDPSVGWGHLPRRNCSQAGMCSSTDAQYLVWKKQETYFKYFKCNKICQSTGKSHSNKICIKASIAPRTHY